MLQESDLVMRGSRWFLRKAVPVRFQTVEKRAEVWKSLRTDSRSEALRRRDAVWDELVAGWEMRLAGQNDDAKAAFAAAERVLKAKALRYVPLEELTAASTAEIIARIEKIDVVGNRPDSATAAAVLGRVARPPILLSEVLELYWSMSKDSIREKSEDQVPRWRNPRIKAVKNLILVIGDKALDALTRDDMLAFRDWWEERIDIEELTANSANKDLIHLGSIIKKIDKRKRLGMHVSALLGDLSFAETDTVKRPSFSDAFIRDHILARARLMDWTNRLLRSSR